MATGGDIREIRYTHPTLGSGVIKPKANEDSTLDEGGYRSDDDASMITGDGEMIDKINAVRWSAECTPAWDMNIRADITQMRALAADPVQADWTVDHINGTVWGGTGKPVGDLQGNMNAATFTLKISGGGEMVKIIG